MKVLRRLLAITLLALFGLPVFSPLFALSARDESSLPACCRRNGKHHCSMSMAERMQMAGRDAQSGAPQFKAPFEKCPYSPSTAPAAPHIGSGLPPAHAIYAELLSHPATAAQTRSRWRIARERSRQKRGPPTA